MKTLGSWSAANEFKPLDWALHVSAAFAFVGIFVVCVGPLHFTITCPYTTTEDGATVLCIGPFRRLVGGTQAASEAAA